MEIVFGQKAGSRIWDVARVGGYTGSGSSDKKVSDQDSWNRDLGGDPLRWRCLDARTVRIFFVVWEREKMYHLIGRGRNEYPIFH